MLGYIGIKYLHLSIYDEDSTRNREVQVIPEEFKAAGLIVPDPSIKPFPMPLSDLETEGNVWYMAPGQ